MLETGLCLDQVDIKFSSAAGRSEAALFCAGWSAAEPSGTWAIDYESVIILPPARHTGPHRLLVGLMPMIIPGDVARQRLLVYFNATLLGALELTEQWVHKELSFEIPAGLEYQHGPNRLVFDHPDAVPPAKYATSTDTRRLSFFFRSLKIESTGSENVALRLRTVQTLFIVMGVCLPGQRPNLEFVKFLYSPECTILLWLDCLDQSDFVGIIAEMRRQFPEVCVGLAPRALWGGPSIVESMLKALSHSIKRIGGWTQVVFTSTLDVPLHPRDRLLSQLASLCFYDFCSSRWTQPTDQVVIPSLFVTADASEPPNYTIYPYRPDTHLRIDSDLSRICTAELIEKRLITTTLSERYCFAVTENFHTSNLSFCKLSKERATEREKFFGNFDLVAGRMWVFCSRRFAEVLTSDEVADIFSSGFRDIFIADECFFQSIAQAYARNNAINVMWASLYYRNADPLIINEEWYRGIIRAAQPGELFARKSVGLEDYSTYFDARPGSEGSTNVDRPDVGA